MKKRKSLLMVAVGAAMIASIGFAKKNNMAEAKIGLALGTYLTSAAGGDDDTAEFVGGMAATGMASAAGYEMAIAGAEIGAFGGPLGAAGGAILGGL